MNKLEVAIITPNHPTDKVKKQVDDLGIEMFNLLQTFERIKREIFSNDSKRLHVNWQLVKGFIAALATREPNQVHYEIARESLRKIDDNLLDNKHANDLLAQKINEYCKKLDRKIVPPTDFKVAKKIADAALPIDGNNAPLLEVLILPDDWVVLEQGLEKDGMLLCDKNFLTTLCSTGKKGKESAGEIKPKLQERLRQFKEEGKNPLISWFNLKPERGPFYLSPLLLTLADALWRDVVEDEIKSPSKVPTYPLSAHLIDQQLPPAIKKVEIRVKGKGIRNLSVSDHNIIKAVGVLLEQKKQSQEKDAFCTGQPLSKALLNSGYSEPPKIIRVSPHEYYTAYMGLQNYSGGDIKFIDKATLKFTQRKFPVVYDYIEKAGTENRTQRIEFEAPLIELFLLYPNLTDKEKERLNYGDKAIKRSKREFIFHCNPIFTHQVGGKFITYPKDINRRLASAAGGQKKVTASMHLLLAFVLRDISAGRPGNKINEDRLVETLELENQRGRKSRLYDRLKKDIDAIKKLGPIKKCEKRKNAVGGYKYVFEYVQKFKW